ncbi:MAG: DUF2244 domain-containing protein [Pseudomonadota bacterium]
MYQFELTPNCALSAQQAVMFFSGVASVSLLIAFAFVLMGYWPILPFAGLELALLGWALKRNWDRGQTSEYVEIDAQDITLTRCDAAGDVVQTIRLPTPWTQVALIRDRRGVAGSELAFGQKGKWWVFGRFLVQQEKQALRRRITEVLRQIRHAAPQSEPESAKRRD